MAEGKVLMTHAKRTTLLKADLARVVRLRQAYGDMTLSGWEAAAVEEDVLMM